ncbi:MULTISPECIES: hypothetical protein [Vibrio]|uniref:hypothetical protein n=1 Tax=Vibrio TaxID=662 RepID=UPI002075FF28|nr:MULTISPECIES: hypothetical protein [Vibrio]USD35474.1 hypothetical protein J8Z27_22915 [Vibrio sp. SCSIO 43186]USD72598.1 hypothetical protein J4N41_22920 [Vibrio sp. SCSIO 43139]USD98989.1 hypothetical protein CTT30_23230 [Vibrio coralliilyticus]
MSSLSMKQFLENVLADKSNRIFGSMDGQSSVRIPQLIRSKNNNTILLYSTDFNALLNTGKLSVNPVRAQLQNLSRAAITYSTFQNLGSKHELSQRLNTSINNFFNGKGEHKRFSTALENEVNSVWKVVFQDKDRAKAITSEAKELLDRAIIEMKADGELEAGNITANKASESASLFLDSFSDNLIHSKNTPLTKANDISELFSNSAERVQEFLSKRFGSSNTNHYLRMLLQEQAGVIQPYCDDINVDLSQLASDIPFREENEPPSDANNIPSARYRKARIDSKKPVRGKVAAYLHRDNEFGQYGVYHLTVAVTKHDGSDHYTNSVILYSHMEDPSDGHSKNELVEYLKGKEEARTYFTPERYSQFVENEKANEERRAKFAEQVRAENAEKRAQALETYNTLSPVTSAEQLIPGYFGKKGLAELAVKHIKGLRVSGDGDVWLPLGNVIEQNLSVENIEAFQNLLREKPSWSETNKLFEGLGDGYKEKCSVTLGNPQTASVIGISEGVANGLIQYEMAQRRGIDLAMVCSLDVGNITSSIKKIVEEHPTKPIVNFADNDLFNSNQEKRFLRHELEAQGKEVTGKTLNIGIDKAIEIHQAINLPYVTYNFSTDIEGVNLEGYQQNNKGSDIDDLLNGYASHLMEQKIENPKQVAWETLEALVAEKITTTLKHSVSRHWTIENQHKYGWCPSLDNLEQQKLPNYYHMRSPIAAAHEVFQEKFGLHYEVYQSMVHTDSWSVPGEVQIAEGESQEVKDYSAAIDASMENAEKGLVEVNANPIETEPMTELDEGIEHLLSPVIEEDKLLIEKKIAVVTRKIDNLTKNAEKYPAANFEERLAKNNAELSKLTDERNRLFGVSAGHVDEVRSVSDYYDRAITAPSDPLSGSFQKEIPNEDLVFESIEDAEISSPSDEPTKSILNSVFNQTYDDEDNIKTSAIEQDGISADGSWTDDIIIDAEQFNNEHEVDPAYQEYLEEEMSDFHQSEGQPSAEEIEPHTAVNEVGSLVDPSSSKWFKWKPLDNVNDYVDSLEKFPPLVNKNEEVSKYSTQPPLVSASNTFEGSTYKLVNHGLWDAWKPAREITLNTLLVNGQISPIRVTATNPKQDEFRAIREQLLRGVSDLQSAASNPISVEQLMDKKPSSDDLATKDRVEHNLSKISPDQLVSLFERVLNQMNESHQKTLSTVTDITKQVLEQQALMQLHITELTEQVSRLTEKVAVNFNSQPSTETEVKNEVEPQQNKESLINEIMEIRKETRDQAEINERIRNKITEATSKPVAPSQLKNVVGKNGMETPNIQTGEPVSKNNYEHLVEQMKQHQNALRTTQFSEIGNDIKALLHQAISEKTNVTLDSITESPTKQVNAINSVLKDILGNNGTRPRGLHISAAISSVMRNGVSESIPNSAVSAYVFAEFTGNYEDPIGRIAKELISGEKTTDTYFEECKAILGNQFEFRMGEEYKEHTERSMQEYHQTQNHQSPPIPDYENQPTI